MAKVSGDSLRAALALCAALALVALAHAGALRVGFVRDDHLLVEENPAVREPAPLGQYLSRAFWSAPGGPVVGAYYRPLVVLSFVADWRLGQGAPRAFHATNLALHLGVCALVFALARRFGAGALAAALACALFGSFPRTGEAVVWISGRTDVLAALGALAALLLHSTAPAAPTARVRRVSAALALFAGLLAKEVAFAGALALVALEWRSRPPAEAPRACAVRLLPAALACAGYAALRASASLPAADFDPFSPLERPLFALEALGSYVAMLADPLRPSLVIGKLGAIDWSRVALGAVAGLAGFALALRAWRRPPAPARAATLTLGLAALAPVLHLIPLPLSVVAADRFLYLPAAALAIGFAESARSLASRERRAALVLCAVALVAFAVATHLRTRDWQDELRLWQREVDRAPAASADAHAELATVLAWRGRSEEAVRLYEEALRRERAFAAEHPRARAERALRSNYALVLSEVGRYAEAATLLEALVQEQPRQARHHLDLGAVRARALEFDQAERSHDAAAALEPGWPLVAQIRRQVQRARALWLPLPPERPGEARGIRVARARVYTLVGRLRDADRAWLELAGEPGLPAEALRSARRYLARRGADSAEARSALARLDRSAAGLPE
jgi:tetratricopeptide (TPR) repeat protein